MDVFGQRRAIRVFDGRAGGDGADVLVDRLVGGAQREHGGQVVGIEILPPEGGSVESVFSSRFSNFRGIR